MKQHFQLCYLITVLRILRTPTNSGCFINVYQQILIVENKKNVQVVNTAKSGPLVWQLPMPLEKYYLCLLLVKQKIQGVLKMLRNFPVDINHNERAGLIVFYFKNGWDMETKNFKLKEEKWHWSLTVARPIQLLRICHK